MIDFVREYLLIITSIIIIPLFINIVKHSFKITDMHENLGYLTSYLNHHQPRCDRDNPNQYEDPIAFNAKTLCNEIDNECRRLSIKNITLLALIVITIILMIERAIYYGNI